MSGYLDLKKLRSIAKIKSFLSDNVEFKIGKTDDLERRESQYKSEGYTNFYVITKCTTLEEVDKLEKDLITFFKHYYSTCKNENDGGGGNTSESEKYYIYLVTK